MQHSGGSLDSTVVAANDNSAEVFAAFEVQSKEFQNVQLEFENYMERLKEDIEMKALKFEHIDYYDALLRDENSKDTAVAASQLFELDERRKPLINVNPLLAATSELPPAPSIENITYEHISLNLPAIAKNALKELDADLVSAPASTDEYEFEPLVAPVEIEKPDEIIEPLATDPDDTVVNEADDTPGDERSDDDTEGPKHNGDTDEPEDNEEDITNKP